MCSHMSASSSTKSSAAVLLGALARAEASWRGLDVPEPDELALLSGPSQGTTSGSSAMVCSEGGTLRG